MSTLTRDRGPRYEVRGWAHDGTPAVPVYTDSADEARDAVARLAVSIPSGTFVAEDTTTRLLLAKARQGFYTDH